MTCSKNSMDGWRQHRAAWLLSALCNAAILLSTERVEAIQAGLINDFQDGVQAWDGLNPVQIPDGGPAGAGDGYLQITSTGGAGSGSKLAMFNQSSDWVGDLGSLGAVSIDVDMFVDPSSESDLAMRLVLFGPANTNNRWTSTDSISVPKDGQWHHLSFPIDAAALTRAAGNSTYDQMMAGIVRAMFRHDLGTPSSQGTEVVAVAGFDNITVVVPDVLPAHDFNGDGRIDVADINLLLTAVRTSSSDTQYDVVPDGVINQDDIVELVTSPAKLNTYIGDVNLDGVFDTSDLVAIFAVGQYEDATPLNSTWETGDWNGDGDFGTGDLLLAFQQGGFEQPPRAAVAAAVPEPSAAILLALGSLGIAGRRRL